MCSFGLVYFVLLPIFLSVLVFDVRLKGKGILFKYLKIDFSFVTSIIKLVDVRNFMNEEAFLLFLSNLEPYYKLGQHSITNWGSSSITNWGTIVLQIRAAFLLQIRAQQWYAKVMDSCF